MRTRSARAKDHKTASTEHFGLASVQIRPVLRTINQGSLQSHLISRVATLLRVPHLCRHVEVESEPEVIRTNTTNENDTIWSRGFNLTQESCADQLNMNSAVHRTRKTKFRRCSELIQSSFSEERRSDLYNLFKDRLRVSEIDFLEAAKDLNISALLDYYDMPFTTASEILNACERSTPFKLLCRLLQPASIREHLNLVKKFCVVWFGVSPYELTQLQPPDRNLFEHFYKGRIIRQSESSSTVSGMHWGCEFWNSFRRALFQITSEYYLENANLGVFTTDADMTAKKTVLFGVSIPFEMVAIFAAFCHDISTLRFSLNGDYLQLRIRLREDTTSIYTAYFAPNN